jgi:transposase
MNPLIIPSRPPKGATIKIEQIERLIDLGKQTFSRRDIEKTENISRASVNRLLRDWLREGVIESQGAGPARKYVLSEKWRTIKS